MKGLILVAGKGTRLRPITHTLPKHMIPLAGKPMMQYSLDHLIDAGIKDIGIVVGYLKKKIMEHFGDGSKFGANFEYIVQEPQMGIAHAIKVSKDYIGDDPFIVYLGDNILKEGIAQFKKKFESGDYDALILLAYTKDPTRFGVADIRDGKIVRLVEKPKVPPSNYALVGVYFFRKSIFEAIEHLKPSWRGELEITDAIQWLLNHNYKVGHQIIRGWWKDTGKPRDLLEALYLILDTLEENINGNISEKSEVLGRVYIGKDTEILENTIIRGPVYIGSKCVIGPNTFIGPYTSIEDNVKISGGEIFGSLIMNHAQIDISDDIRIIDSIIGTNAKVIRSSSKKRGLRLVIGETSIIEI
ncbi:MAG: glucose-1-phosphate thymidylyltransferase [Candidatus Njordarchaeota archaeon]